LMASTRGWKDLTRRSFAEPKIFFAREPNMVTCRQIEFDEAQCAK